MHAGAGARDGLVPGNNTWTIYRNDVAVWTLEGQIELSKVDFIQSVPIPDVPSKFTSHTPSAFVLALSSTPPPLMNDPRLQVNN